MLCWYKDEASREEEIEYILNATSVYLCAYVYVYWFTMCE